MTAAFLETIHTAAAQHLCVCTMSTRNRVRQRRWYLQPRDRRVYLIRDGQEASSFAALKMGPIKDLSIGREHAKGSKQALLVLFEDNNKGIVSRENFEWNKNDFSREFKSTSSASEFIEKFQALTTFDLVHQVVLTREVDEPESLQSQESYLEDTLEEHDRSVEVHMGEKRTNDHPEQPTPAKKKRKTDTCEVGNVVESKKVGLLDILVKNCDEPPTFRLLRRVDPVFVTALKSRLKEDSSGIGIPPLAVVCKDVQNKSQFEERLKDIYRYEVHGGLHGIKARQELNAEGYVFKVVSCHVYVGLNDEEALWLASRHNANGHFQHQMTHRDYVEICRSRLYVLNGKNPSQDETPTPSADWKRACTKCILPEGYSRTQRENIFAQAVFTKGVWEKVQTVMDMYEDGALKDQKLHKKHLTSIPEFKQHLLQPLHHLNADFLQEVLQSVIDGDMSLKELKEEAINFRALQAIRQAFIRCTSSQSWDEATTKYPAFTTDDRLTHFMKLDFTRQNIPDAFKAYCQSALSSEMPSFGTVTIVDGVRVAIAKGTLSSVSAQDLKEVDPTYPGAQLILTSIPEDYSTDMLQKMAYTSRQLNSLNASLPFFNLAVICTLGQIDAVKAALLKCFDSAEVAYAYNKSTQLGGNQHCLLTPSLKGIVVGHWSQAGSLEANQINEDHHNVFTYDADDSLYSQLIVTFSFDGQTIVDATESGSIAAVKNKRNLVAICEDPVRAQNIMDKLNP